jgi:hypothetical protein
MHVCLVRATFPAHLILNLIIVVYGVEYILCSVPRISHQTKINVPCQRTCK